MISFAVTAKLICVFVFAYAKNQFSHDVAHFIVKLALSCDECERQVLIMTRLKLCKFSLFLNMHIHYSLLQAPASVTESGVCSETGPLVSP